MKFPPNDMSVVFAQLPLADPSVVEMTLLCECEDLHFDLPELNSQRGYARDSDRHHRHRDTRSNTRSEPTSANVTREFALRLRADGPLGVEEEEN
jgi:hypothetical protein